MPSFSFDHPLTHRYSVFDGLAGMRVSAIHQDGRGFVWIATEDGGVSRFDGRNFRTYGRREGLPHPTVMAIAGTEDGQLAFATLGGGLALFNGEAFRVYDIHSGLPHNEVLGVSTWGKSLWVATAGGAARLVDGAVVETVTTIKGEAVGRVYDVAVDASGHTWLASRSLGVVNLHGQRLSWVDEAGNDLLADPWGLAADAHGRLWIATKFVGTEAYVFCHDPERDKLERVDFAEITGGLSVKSGVRHVRVDRREWLWAVHRGVCVFDGEQWHRFLFDAREGSTSDIRLTYEDQEGNIWIGLWDGGVVCCDPHTVQRFTEKDGLPDPEVNCLTTDAQGRVWVGTMGGLACIEDEKIMALSDRFLVLCLAVDPQGRLWAGSDQGRIYQWTSGRLQAIQVAGEEDEIQSLCFDDSGRLWLSTSTGIVGRLEHGRFATVVEEAPIAKVIAGDEEGRVWIGAYAMEPALSWCDSHSGHFHVVEDAHLREVRYVEALCRRDSALWIGTGIGLFECDEGGIRHFTREEGLAANTVLALAVDRRGELWIGTGGGGVQRYDGQQFKTIRLGEGVSENTVKAITCSAEGRIWLGTRQGVVVYRPGEHPPRLYIRQVIAGQTYDEPQQVSFSEQIPQLRILYQGIGFRAQMGALLYRYRLSGTERDHAWSAFSPCQEAAFGDLAAGDYLFEVQAMDRDGLRSEVAALPIKVDPDPASEHLQALSEMLRKQSQPLLGQSAAMGRVLERIGAVAEADIGVLIMGETGTGKGLVAQTIHHASRRANQPFIKVNCGAIPPGLVESELFGHEKGAFTGALGRRIGYFELAAGGTILLDEVADLPLESQAVLLHVLEEHALRRVGSARTIPVDVRVMAATNRDLESAVAQGRFRADLFYRLNVARLELPPLRERREDIPALAEYFLEAFARHLHRPVPALSQEVLDFFQQYSWPGNVRELDNLLQQALLVCRDGEIRLRDLSTIREGTAMGEEGRGRAHPYPGGRGALDRELAYLETREREIIEAALAATNGTVFGPRGAARLLGIHPQKLRSRMRKYGLKSPRERKKGGE